VELLAKDSTVDLLVDSDTDGSLGHVENNSGASVVVLERHTLVDGGINFDINIVSSLEGSQVSGRWATSLSFECLLEQSSSACSVDIKVDSSIHKGMPFKFYHGRTGVVFNVTKRAVGVVVNKEVNGRILRKQVHIATPHLKPSTCQSQIIARKQSNEQIKNDVRAGKAPRQNLKRENTQPKSGYFYTLTSTPETIQPLPYVDLV